MKTVLVTGSAGFIGSHTCEALLRKGYHVVGIDNMHPYYDPEIKEKNQKMVEGTAASLNSSYEFYRDDLLSEILLDSIFYRHKIDVVIHLAAYAGVRPSILDPKGYFEVNVLGTLGILEAMKKYRVKKLLYASSSSVYGNNQKVPFAETDPVDHAISPYAASKKAGEVLCHAYHHLYQMNIACLRFFTVYGPRQRPDLAIHKFTKLMDEGKPIPFYGDGSMRRDHTYIEDIIDGVMKALQWVDQEGPCYDIFNLGESHTISLTNLVDLIASSLGKPAIIDHQPMQDGDVNITYADITHSKEILGYAPKTLIEEGIPRFIKWYQENKQNK